MILVDSYEIKLRLMPYYLIPNLNYIMTNNIKHITHTHREYVKAYESSHFYRLKVFVAHVRGNRFGKNYFYLLRV